jgi:hypothetical protein
MDDLGNLLPGDPVSALIPTSQQADRSAATIHQVSPDGISNSR